MRHFEGYNCRMENGIMVCSSNKVANKETSKVENQLNLRKKRGFCCMQSGVLHCPCGKVADKETSKVENQLKL